MIITHKTPGTTARVVIACQALNFVDGVAEHDLTPSQAAAVRVHGHTVTDSKPGKKAKTPTIQKADIEPDIGSDVEVTEQAPPEIG